MVIHHISVLFVFKFMYMIIPEEHATVGTNLIIRIGNKKFIYSSENAKGEIDEKWHCFSVLLKTQTEKGFKLNGRIVLS